MHAQEDARQGAVVHGLPEAAEAALDARAHRAGLVGDGEGGVVGLAQLAAHAVEFFGGEGEGDGVRAVRVEGEGVPGAVVEAGGLEAGACEGGVAGGVCGSVSLWTMGCGGVLGGLKGERVRDGRL